MHAGGMEAPPTLLAECVAIYWQTVSDLRRRVRGDPYAQAWLDAIEELRPRSDGLARGLERPRIDPQGAEPRDGDL